MILALALQAAVAGIPGFAVQPSADERLALPHIADALRATEAPARARSLDAALALLPQPTRFRGAFQCMRGSMLMSADPKANRATAFAAIDECLRLLPDAPLAQRIAADAAFTRGRMREGATLLTRALTADPRLARGLTAEQLDAVFRRLGYERASAERAALAIALSRTDVARNDPARLSGWTRESVLAKVEAGDLAGAGALLPYVVDPEDGLAMLVDRRFEPLWPRMETWSGGTLDAQRRAFVAAVRAGYEAAPTLGRARETAAALARSGEVAEALALLDRAVVAFGAPRDDYDYARAVVRLGALRAQAGEADPARITAPLEAALANGATTYLVNVVPNLAVDQIALGRPQAALATLDRYPTGPAKVETAVAYGYFVAIRGCALAKLGRTAEAEAAFAEVARRYAANTGAAGLATGCGGSDAQVLAGWLKRVDDPETRATALMGMIRARAGVAPDRLSLSDGRLAAIKDRAEVSERMARFARPLPAGYLPALRLLAGD